METLPVYLFGTSYPSFEDLLRAHGLPYEVPIGGRKTSDVPADVLEVCKAADCHSSWPKLARVVQEFSIHVAGRTVLLVLKDQIIRHAEDLNQPELEQLLSQAESLNVFDSKLSESIAKRVGVHALYRNYEIKIDAVKKFPNKPSALWTGQYEAYNRLRFSKIDGECSLIAWSRAEVKAEALEAAKKAIDDHLDSTNR